MIASYNSFYGNRHTKRSPLGESLLDIFRRSQLRDVHGVRFYSPEIRALNYDDRDNPKTGGFQVVVRFTDFPTYDPRWSISIQEKSYSTVNDITKKHAVGTLVEERLMAEGLMTDQAFETAMSVYSKLRWNADKDRKQYKFAEMVIDDVVPALTEGEKNFPAVSILSMPAYEKLRLGTHRLEEKRTSVFNKLREEDHMYAFMRSSP